MEYAAESKNAEVAEVRPNTWMIDGDYRISFLAGLVSLLLGTQSL